MSAATLGKVAIGLAFPLVGIMYLRQNQIAKTFSKQPYYLEAIQLIKEYKPIVEKLGDPIYCSPIDVSDSFNYQDDKEARVKVPLQGANYKAFVRIYAKREDYNWKVDTMEVEYPNSIRYKFYDSSLIKK